MIDHLYHLDFHCPPYRHNIRNSFHFYLNFLNGQCIFMDEIIIVKFEKNMASCKVGRGVSTLSVSSIPCLFERDTKSSIALCSRIFTLFFQILNIIKYISLNGKFSMISKSKISFFLHGRIKIIVNLKFEFRKFENAKNFQLSEIKMRLKLLLDGIFHSRQKITSWKLDVGSFLA